MYIKAPSSDILREQLRHAIEHFAHVLPSQAPIKDFVHHNTLHGFQHLSFFEALKAAHEVTGAYGYLPPEQFRRLYDQGRIDDSDLDYALQADRTLEAERPIAVLGESTLRRRDIYMACLRYPFRPVTGCQLNWQQEEKNAFCAFQEDLPAQRRRLLLERSGSGESETIAALWSACLEQLGLEHFIVHPEELLDLSTEQAERMMTELAAVEEVESADRLLVHRLMRREAERQRVSLFKSVGPEITLGGLLSQITGVDIREQIRPLLVRHLAGHLDQGVASWHNGSRDQGFYRSWRASALDDQAWLFEEMPDWRDQIESLDDDPLEAISGEMMRLGVAEDQWINYLEHLALELPGWSGMFLWRHQHPGYDGQEQVPVEMADYLAVRLVLERLYAQRLCRDTWQIEPSLDVMRWYFKRRRSEFYVRHALFNSHLPEYLATLAQRLSDHYAVDGEAYRQWQHLGDMIWTWRQSPSSDRPEGYGLHRDAWPLFRLAQHLGLSAGQLRGLDPEQIGELFTTMQRLEPQRLGHTWLLAYERHYREQIFNAIANNRGRGRWSERSRRPQAQLVFCMDDREEGIRRYLEANN
ncbi:MAG: DUF2309 domain-containing protein, partial [Candidatus Sedimenticola endophacoides]